MLSDAPVCVTPAHEVRAHVAREDASITDDGLTRAMHPC